MKPKMQILTKETYCAVPGSLGEFVVQDNRLVDAVDAVGTAGRPYRRSCENDHGFENAEYKPETYLDGGPVGAQYEGEYPRSQLVGLGSGIPKPPLDNELEERHSP